MAMSTPIITATLDPSGYVTLVVSVTDADRVSVRRVTESEGSVPVRSAENLDAALGVVYGADYEIPQSEVLRYYAVAMDGSMQKTSGIVSIDGLDRGADWIAPLGTPLNGMAINVKGVGSLTHKALSASARPLGRRDTVTVQWGRGLPEGTVEFITLDDSERVRFMSIVNSGRVVLFQPRIGYGFEEPCFLSVGDIRENRPSRLGGEQVRVFECEVTFTKPPPPKFKVPVGVSWQARVGESHDWNHRAATSSWLDLAGLA